MLRSTGLPGIHTFDIILFWNMHDFKSKLLRLFVVKSNVEGIGSKKTFLSFLKLPVFLGEKKHVRLTRAPSELGTKGVADLPRVDIIAVSLTTSCLLVYVQLWRLRRRLKPLAWESGRPLRWPPSDQRPTGSQGQRGGLSWVGVQFGTRVGSGGGEAESLWMKEATHTLTHAWLISWSTERQNAQGTKMDASQYIQYRDA